MVALRFVADAAESRLRLDRVLAERYPDISRSTFQRWIEAGRVTVDGQVANRRSHLRPQGVVLVQPAPPPPSEALPQAMPLTILYEDASLLVLDKPAGLVVHPAAGHADGTLVNGLLHHAAIGGEDRRRPGIVHRLDKDTSGILVVAKTDAAKRGLVEQFQRHSIIRQYLAIVVGKPAPSGTFETLIGRHPVDRKRFTTRVREGKSAITHWRVRQQFDAAALVECQLKTGRTHQIRVHFADAGYPLLGDPLYGKTPPGKMPRGTALRGIARALGRQALHAAVLGFVHPEEDRAMHFESNLPEDLQQALRFVGELG